MPPLPPTPSPVLEFIWSHGVDSTVGITFKTRHSYSGPAPSSSTLAALALGAGTTWPTNMAAMLTANGVLEQVTCIDLANPATPAGISSPAAAGTRTGVIPSMATCALIDQVITRRFRGSRPKCFTPYGVETDVVAGNVWSSGFQSSLETAWIAFMAGINILGAGGLVLTGTVGVSYFEGFTVVTSPTTHRARNVPTQRVTPLVTPVVSYRVRAALASQRRRLLLP